MPWETGVAARFWGMKAKPPVCLVAGGFVCRAVPCVHAVKARRIASNIVKLPELRKA
jgi:hypothetical protein